jgi:hypothetical protein
MRSSLLFALLAAAACCGQANGQEPPPPPPAIKTEPVRAEQQKAADQKDVERLQKQVELLQKQIDVLQKLVDLLADQAKKQPADAAAVKKLQDQIADLEAGAKRSARRDEQLAGAVDDLREQADVQERTGPRLPATLKELFLPTQPNESPLSIYGVLAFGYAKQNGSPAGFQFGEFSPQFLLQLNERFLLEGEISVGPGGAVSLGRAQVDMVVNDWLTVIGGNFEAPIGFFNERLNHPWFNKFPDTAVFFHQVSPADLLLLGLQARGAAYLGGSPVKLEYNAYITNGLNSTVAAPGLMDVADLGGLENTYNVVTSSPAVGGRIGLWVPAPGLTAGLSFFHNGSYLAGLPDELNLWQLDAGWRHGNWDLRFEYAEMYQQAASVIGNNIRRSGAFAQVAYRPYDAPWRVVQRAEVAFRYSYARFQGIDPTALTPAAFASPQDLPVDRNQYTVGFNYYLYPAMVLKFAYEINQEIGPVQLNDNLFQIQFAWSF